MSGSLAEQRSTPQRMGDCAVELRQYTLHPGQRDTLIELFDREFIESQEAVGITIIGQFRDIDRDDRFVWIRTFPDMTARADSLAAFYGGPAWARHRDAANATMIDSSDVLMLRPAGSTHGFSRLVRPVSNACAQDGGVVLAGIISLADALDPVRAERLAVDVGGLVRDGGGTPVAALVSEHGPNTFPALPVREDAEVFVWIATFADAAAGDLFAANRSVLTAAMAREESLARGHEILRLAPTDRSALRG